MKLVKTTNEIENNGYVLEGDANDIHKLFGSLKKPDPTPNSVFHKAVRAGWIPPLKNPRRMKNPMVVSIPLVPSYNPLHVKLLRMLENSSRPDPFIDWDQLERTPELLDYQEDFLDYWFIEGCQPTAGDWYELAKFIVPPNRVGIVRDIQTALTWWSQTQPDWLRGDPNTNRVDNYFPSIGPQAEWHLRIEPFGNNVDPTNNRIMQNLPGQAFNKLPTWRMMRFMWGYHHPVQWIIPQASVLSLWCGRWDPNDPSQTQDWRQIAGLLKGATQPENSKQTFRNVTRAW